MSSTVVAASPQMSVARLVELLVDENIGAIPVVNADNRPLGIVTRADVLEEDELDAGDEGTAGDLMREPALTVAPGTPVEEAARIMASMRVHHLMVVDGDGRLVGLVSSFDVVRWVADDGPNHVHS